LAMCLEKPSPRMFDRRPNVHSSIKSAGGEKGTVAINGPS
jgi:hypothetical protein